MEPLGYEQEVARSLEFNDVMIADPQLLTTVMAHRTVHGAA